MNRPAPGLVDFPDGLIDYFETGDIVTIRENTEQQYRVLDKRDPRGCDPKTSMELCCVPLVLLWPINPANQEETHGRLIEPRDLRLVEGSRRACSSSFRVPSSEVSSGNGGS